MALIGVVTSAIGGAYSINEWIELSEHPTTNRTIPQFGSTMWNFEVGWYDATKDLLKSASQFLLGDPSKDVSQGNFLLR